jgi:hypothetical protein
MAAKKDPTVSSDSVVGSDYPEGTHPARPASEVTTSAVNLSYRDLSDEQKPDPSTVAQEQVLEGDEASA